MATATKTKTTDGLWQQVLKADQRRQEVRARIDATAEQIDAARKQLVEANSEKARESPRDALAGLLAEASVLPLEFVGASDAYANALHHWATADLRRAKEGEQKARKVASEAYEREGDELAALAAAEEAQTPRDRRALREKTKGDKAAIAMRAGHAADIASRGAAEQAKPIRRQVADLVRPVFGPPKHIGETHEAIGEIVDGKLTGHEGWLEGQSEQAERALLGGE